MAPRVFVRRRRSPRQPKRASPNEPAQTSQLDPPDPFRQAEPGKPNPGKPRALALRRPFQTDPPESPFRAGTSLAAFRVAGALSPRPGSSRHPSSFEGSGRPFQRHATLQPPRHVRGLPAILSAQRPARHA
ncbi:MAG: hypothetical protein SFZ23_06045 [Planctomycetota bacterium]|nr:hypothetical protein [Planctomycetota bacterium]